MNRKRKRRHQARAVVTPLAAFIKKSRKESGLTQQDLSNLSKVGVRTLAAIEGGSDPKISSVLKLSTALEASLDEMMGRTG